MSAEVSNDGSEQLFPCPNCGELTLVLYFWTSTDVRCGKCSDSEILYYERMPLPEPPRE